MSRPKKGPRCGTCRHLDTPTDDKGNRLIQRSYRFPCAAPFEPAGSKPDAVEFKVTRVKMLPDDGDNCPAYQSVSDFNTAQPRTRRKRQSATPVPAEAKNGNNEPAAV